MSYEEALANQRKFFEVGDLKADLFVFDSIVHKNFDRYDTYHLAPQRVTYDDFITEEIIKKLRSVIAPAILNLMQKYPIIVAGGVFTSIWKHCRISDVDLFLIGPNSDMIDEIITQISKAYDAEFTYNQHTITIRLKDSILPYTKKYQLILRNYQTISEVLHGFDIGSCCLAFDNKKIYSTSLGIFAIRYGYNIVDMSMRSTTYEKRLSKYFDRGFGIIFPKMQLPVFVASDWWLKLKFCAIYIEEVSAGKIRGRFENYVSCSYNYDNSPTILVYNAKYGQDFSRKAWKLHHSYFKPYNYIRKHPELQLEKLLSNEIYEKVYEEMAQLLAPIMEDINKNGYNIINSNPTTQKFGMFDPTETTDEEWYGVYCKK